MEVNERFAALINRQLSLPTVLEELEVDITVYKLFQPNPYTLTPTRTHTHKAGEEWVLCGVPGVESVLVTQAYTQLITEGQSVAVGRALCERELLDQNVFRESILGVSVYIMN